jgi:hypothetical protein
MTGQINLSWTDNSSNEDGFNVYRGTASGSLSQIDSVGSNTTSYTDANVTDATTYYYQVESYTNHASSSSGEVSVTAGLSAPSGLSASQGSNDDELDLSWTKNDDNGGGGWQIYRSGADNPSKPGDYSQVDTISNIGTTSYTDTGLANGKTYSYFVRRSVNGRTADTGTASKTTPLSAGTLSAATVSSSQIDLSWTKNDNSAAGDWEIYRSTDGSLGSFIASPSLGATAFSDTGLSEASTYYYTLRRVAEDASSDSTQRSTTTPPAAPSGLSLSYSDTKMELSWTDNSSGEDGFTVYRTTASSPSFPGDYTSIADLGADTTSYMDTDSLSSETYHYAVTADANGFESSEATNSITLQYISATATTELPDAQQPTLGNGVEDEIAVSWPDVTDYGDYRIQVEETNTGSDWSSGDTGWFETTVGEAMTSYDVTGREDGEEYRVRMRTETEHVTGNWTSPVSIATKFPGASSLTVSNVTKTSAALSWTDNADNEDGFRIQHRKEYDHGFGPWTTITDLAPNTTSGTDDQLQPNRTYEFRIEAYTEHTTATSGTVEKTTTSTNVRQTRIPANRTVVEVDHPDGETLRPSILSDPQYKPALRDTPTIEVPVPFDDAWLADAFEGVEMRCWLDGDRLPIDTLDDIRIQPEQVVLVGSGGAELDQRVQTSVQQAEAHAIGETLVEDTTSYVANFDTPADVLTTNEVQSADSQTTWESVLQTIPANSPAFVDEQGTLRNHDASFFLDAGTAFANLTSTGQEATASDSGYAVIASTLSDSETVTVNYTIPASHVAVAIRYRNPQDPDTDSQGEGFAFDVTVGGETLFSQPADWGGQDNYSWFSQSGISTDVSGDTTIAIDGGSGGTETRIDAVVLYDDRFTFTFDNAVDSNGHLSGPEPKPDLERVQTTDVTVPEQVVGGELTAAIDDTTGSQAVAISNDEGDSWVTASNSTSVTGSFGTGTPQIRAQLGLSRYGTRSTHSPTSGFNSQQVDRVTLSADLDRTPLVVDRAFDDSLKSILQEIADLANAVWELRYDASADAMAVEWTLPGEREATATDALIDYDVTKSTADQYRKVVVRGQSTPVPTQTFTAEVDEPVELTPQAIKPGSDIVRDPDTGDVLVRDDDYEIDWTNGTITALADGSMIDSAEYAIEYRKQPVGSAEADSYQPGDTPLIETVPAATSKRECQQAALYLVRELQDPIFTATVVLSRVDAGTSLIDNLAFEGLPNQVGRMTTESVDNTPEQVRLQLGSRPPLADLLQDVTQRLGATEKAL